MVIKLMDKELKECMIHHHYREKDFSLMKEVYQEMMSQIWLTIATEPIDSETSYSIFPSGTAVVLISLGKKIDLLQEAYLKEEKIEEAYMLECLSMELLQRSYQKLDEILFSKYGKYCGSMEFLGDKYPLEWEQELMHLFTQNEIILNSSYEFIPSKSVMMLVELTEDKGNECKNICENCNNVTCQSRKKPSFDAAKLTYGYQHIFSGNRRK